MNEEKPKSFWKKSIKGRMALVIWLAIFAFTIMLGCFGQALIGYSNPMSDWFFGLGFIVGCCLGGGLFLIYIVWPLLQFFFWKHWRRTLFCLACFVTLIALFYAEEDWRGKHDWNKFKREQEAKGEKLDFKDFAPPPVPDDQNFALTPIVYSSYGQWLTRDGEKKIPYDTNVVNRMLMEIGGYSFGDLPVNGRNWLMAKPEDLAVWQNYYRMLAAKTNEFPVSPPPQSPAQDVLLALSKYDSNIEELRVAAQMPYSRFPLEYDKDDPAAILLPHLAAFKRCALLLELRAEAELQNGQSDKAFDDAMLTLRLTDKIQTEPFIITHLVRIAMLEIILQPIYDGLAEHKWSDAQLVELDSELAKMDFLADYEFSVRGENAAHIKIISYLEQKRSRFNDLINMFGAENSDQRKQVNKFFVFAAVYLGPKGWFYQNDIALSQMNERWNLPVVDDAQQTVSRTKANETQSAYNSLRGSPFNFIARPLIFPMGSYAKKAAYGQNWVDLARVAIALERYRLADGNYPDSLDSLTAQFPNGIPHDIINGQPLNYRRTSDGQFVLYSVGWNETDDGGVVGLTKSGSVNNRKGDWVWRYPQK